jgi:hypothetical protein
MRMGLENQSRAVATWWRMDSERDDQKKKKKKCDDRLPRTRIAHRREEEIHKLLSTFTRPTVLDNRQRREIVYHTNNNNNAVSNRRTTGKWQPGVLLIVYVELPTPEKADRSIVYVHSPTPQEANET